MKHLIIAIILFLSLGSSGKGESGDIPSRVEKRLNRVFKKNEVVLQPVKMDDETKAEKNFREEFFSIIDKEDQNHQGFLHIGRVKTCRAGVCSAPGENFAGGDSEYFDYFIVFNPDFSVKHINIFSYQASHGHEVTAKGWLRQFQGYSGDEKMQVGKEIDGISGATISVHAITDDVKAKTEMLRQNME